MYCSIDPRKQTMWRSLDNRACTRTHAQEVSPKDYQLTFKIGRLQQDRSNVVFTDEFADLGRDFGALKAHLTNESAKSSNRTCSGGLTYHKQLPEGPDVTQSASASGRQADSRQSWLEGRLNVPLHVLMLQSASATLVGAKAVTYLSMSSHTGSRGASPAAMSSGLP